MTKLFIALRVNPFQKSSLDIHISVSLLHSDRERAGILQEPDQSPEHIVSRRIGVSPEAPPRER